ncbi:carbohydrate-binding protein [Chitinophaga parva]|uniref:Carbohydrate-binding protein n=1 Tax=Chitinophaga parva TaxID=2169414 RepID=A0A2T7BBD8_9BACT|nr:DUF4382 domain-containing protein [Chitinophaga parva]PUZ21709.1 carbohydrate-binding protein [Chitinophaga parva]
MKKISLLLILPAILIFAACKKDNKSGTAAVTMRLTDAPAAYDHVFIDIQRVEVTMEGSSTTTITPVHPGVYDLLSLKNGLDTLLAQTTLPAATIGQIRLVLGSNNSLVVNGTSYPLNTPSAQESGLKLNFHQSLSADSAYTIWIDFDAAKSIVQTGNGGYKLKPVIRAYSAITNGQIKGYVLPLAAGAIVYAAAGTDTLSAIPNTTDGFFRISGLATGTYKVWITPAMGTGLQPYTNANVSVSYGIQTDLGTITLLP